jgi:hypothetical protein
MITMFSFTHALKHAAYSVFQYLRQTLVGVYESSKSQDQNLLEIGASKE